MKFASASLLLISIFTTSLAFAGPQPCTKVTGECDAIFEPVAGRKTRYTSTYNLSTPNADVTNAVVMIHASDRKVQWGYDNLNGLVASGQIPANTLVVAPLLMAPADNPPEGFLFWHSNEWSGGFDSKDGSLTSSFTVIDEVIRKIVKSGNFPNLKTLMVTGLSAGGQTVHRYAVGTEIDHEFPEIRFRFIVVAPSSYVYLTADRLVPGTQDQFAPPQNPACANYNDYRYGLDNPSAYMATRSQKRLADNFVSREVAIISGELDDATGAPNPPIASDPKDGKGLDVSCQAMLQGKSRIERSYVYHKYLSVMFPESKHIWYSVPGLAHSYLVYNDPRTVNYLNFR
ncbi:MAG: hypothetical protein K0R29_2338 [Pseudobdellovibrio sp.]|jgi:hypothetical protein|nr:hypothetical protein [Pseudobdellovibrio sp.]